MKTLKKVFAALSSLVLAVALMVPTLAWAEGEDMAVRVNYAGTPLVLSELDGVPHSIAVTFHVHADYEGYADAAKDVTFTLADNAEMKNLRVATSTRNSDGSYTVVLSNGNNPLPLTDGAFLDLGTLSVKIDGTLDKDAVDADAMREASIVITDLDTSDSTFYTTSSVGADSGMKEVPFTLADSSFATVVGTGSEDPGTDPGTDPGADPGTDPGIDQGTDPSTDNGGAQQNGGFQPNTNGPVGGGLATTGDEFNPIMQVVGAAILCAAIAVVFARKPKDSK